MTSVNIYSLPLILSTSESVNSPVQTSQGREAVLKSSMINGLWIGFSSVDTLFVLLYPDNADLSHAFVSRVVPRNQAWPADAMPLLVAHLLRISLLTDEDVRLACENAMDYWWIAVEPEPHDKGLRAISLSLFQTEAMMDFAVVREAFLQQIESIGDDSTRT
jgi:hypothetical protein